MTKVTIISGFLGAGKTTLIKKLLKEAFAGEKCVLLENEYGEIGIDGGFMKDSGIQISELNSGCICCTLAGDFTKAIGELVEKYHPDRLIIEPSGVGKLSDIRRVVEQEEKEHGEIHLTGCATIVDAGKCKMYLKNFAEFFIDQIKCAETVILSRTQLVSEEKLEKAVELVREQNADARLITTPWDDITGQVIMDAIEHPTSLIDVDSVCPHHEHHHHHHDHDHEEHCCCGHHHHHHDHDADEVFTSWGVETARKFTKAEVEHALTELDTGNYGMILRSKGIVDGGADGWLEFDYVPGEWEVRARGADVGGKLVVIGSKLNEKAIAELFGC